MKTSDRIIHVFTLRLPDGTGLRRPPDEDVFTAVLTVKHGRALKTDAREQNSTFVQGSFVVSGSLSRARILTGLSSHCRMMRVE